jgi:hypothetical protein
MAQPFEGLVAMARSIGWWFRSMALGKRKLVRGISINMLVIFRFDGYIYQRQGTNPIRYWLLFGPICNLIDL